MGPDRPIPYPDGYAGADHFVDSLLSFLTTSEHLQNFCGGIHVLDFYTRTPDIFSTVVPQSWRDWFATRSVSDIMQLILREDLSIFSSRENGRYPDVNDKEKTPWRDGPSPPESLLKYIRDVRRHTLDRTFDPNTVQVDFSDRDVPPDPNLKEARRHHWGMKAKKIHEVQNFANYIEKLTTAIQQEEGQREISHVVDFGSGRNYLGRTLACPPYSKHVVAVEGRLSNIESAKTLDKCAELAPKIRVRRNKKEFKAQSKAAKKATSSTSKEATEQVGTLDDGAPGDIAATSFDSKEHDILVPGAGRMQYILHKIKDGDLSDVIAQIGSPSLFREQQNGDIFAKSASDTTYAGSPQQPIQSNPSLLVLSIHSCGNLLHHGLRSIELNPAVTAVAMVGCCYNLMTERLGPPTYKLPGLRSHHPRLEETSNAFDPHGFPMSDRLCNYTHTSSSSPLSAGGGAVDINAARDGPPVNGVERGVRLNITARMMAVQAPYNWTEAESSSFFTGHFYRALLQRLFLEHGVIADPSSTSSASPIAPSSPQPTQKPTIIGTLPRSSFASFSTYVRAAVARITRAASDEPDSSRLHLFETRLSPTVLTDTYLTNLERRFDARKKELAIAWTLMAFSAGVVESAIVVDRWLWLREQQSKGIVGRCWVERVFDYGISPRSFVVVGVRRVEKAGDRKDEEAR